jgi:hypothetical protein
MRLADLQPASFRGARFLAPSDTAEEGRNNIEHQYPDGGRFLEDNGRNETNFRITAILHGPNVRSDFARLKRALMRPGPGTLQHPWWGRKRVAVMGRYSVRRDDRDAGVLELDIPLGVTSGNSFPSLVSGIPASVGALAQAAFAQIFGDLADQWTPGGSGGTFTTATALKDQCVALATSVAAGTGRGNAANEVIRSASAQVQSGAVIGPALQAMFAEPFEDLALTGLQLTSAFRASADTVDDIAYAATQVRVRTVESQLRSKVLTALADHSRAAVYVASAWAISDRDHLTVDEVEADEAYLYDLVREIQDSESMTAEARTAIGDMQAAISEVLAERILRTPRIIQLNAAGIPAAALSYQLYDSEDNADLLINLNPDQNPIWVDGVVNVLVDEA